MYNHSISISIIGNGSVITNSKYNMSKSGSDNSGCNSGYIVCVRCK